MRTIEWVLASAGFAAVGTVALGQSPPPNDDFTNRTVLTGNAVTFAGTLAGASVEADEPEGSPSVEYLLFYPVTESVWWSWTAPETTMVNLEILGSPVLQPNLDALAVYATNNVFAPPPGVQPLAAMILISSIAGQTLTFPVIGGSNYQIQLLGSSSGSYWISLIATNAPILVEPPRSVTVSTNASTLFTVVAEGVRPFSYQWYWDGTNLPGETAPMLALTNIVPAQAGTYTVAVSNATGAVTSPPATLAISQSNLPPELAPVAEQSGQFHFSLTGESGRGYRIQSSTNLVDWPPETSFLQFVQYPNAYVVSPGYVLTSVIVTTNDERALAVTNLGARKFIRAMLYAPANEICVNNLRQIRFAKSLWARDNGMGSDGLPSALDIEPYFPHGTLPCCPDDADQDFFTSYSVGNGRVNPTCNIVPATHVLEEP